MKKISLNIIRVKSPCTVAWDTMAGDETVRFCKECNKNVCNISTLTRDDAEKLINENEGRLCVRYYLRKDGTIVTRDCMPIVTRLARFLPLAPAVLAALCFMTFAATPAEHPCLMGVPFPVEVPPTTLPTTVPKTATATAPATTTAHGNKDADDEQELNVLMGELP
jgi:hypothetical protein